MRASREGVEGEDGGRCFGASVRRCVMRWVRRWPWPMMPGRKWGGGAGGKGQSGAGRCGSDPGLRVDARHRAKAGVCGPMKSRNWESSPVKEPSGIMQQFHGPRISRAKEGRKQHGRRRTEGGGSVGRWGGGRRRYGGTNSVVQGIARLSNGVRSRHMLTC